MMSLNLFANGCCKRSVSAFIDPTPLIMPQEVKDALPLSDAVFRAYSLGVAKTRCKIEASNRSLSPECEKVFPFVK